MHAVFSLLPLGRDPGRAAVPAPTGTPAARRALFTVFAVRSAVSRPAASDTLAAGTKTGRTV